MAAQKYEGYMLLTDQKNTLFTGLAAVLFGLSLIGSGALAQTTPADSRDHFTVYDIFVEEKGRTSADARARAVQTAAKQGWYALLTKLVDSDSLMFVPEPEKTVLDDMIRGFEIQNERSSKGEYSASFSFAFAGDQVRAFLDDASVPYAIDGAGASMLSFLHRDGNGLHNLNRESLTGMLGQVGGRNRLLKYHLLENNFKERIRLKASDIATNGHGALEGIALDIGISNSLILLTEIVPIDRYEMLTLNYSCSLKGGNSESSGIIRALKGETVRDLQLSVLKQCLGRVDNFYRADLQIFQQDFGEVVITVDTPDYTNLTQFQSMISELALVNRVEAISIGVPLSYFKITFSGTNEQLYSALRQEGYRVALDEMLGMRVALKQD